MTPWVSFEGLSGGGKSTAIDAIAERLIERGYSVTKIDIESAPNSALLGEAAKFFSLHDKSRMMLFWILRLEQFKAVQAASSQFDIVITDRFWGSTVAIDQYGNGVPAEIMSWFASEISGQPDLTFFFDVPLEVARARKPGKAPSLQDERFVERTVRGYKQLALENDWMEVDTTFSAAKVADICVEIICNQFSK